jgi:hypothetical protein
MNVFGARAMAAGMVSSARTDTILSGAGLNTILFALSGEHVRRSSDSPGKHAQPAPPSSTGGSRPVDAGAEHRSRRRHGSSLHCHRLWWNRRVDDDSLAELAQQLLEVNGVVAVVLGGSRARGTHRPDSDFDLGLYYRGSIDVAALRVVAARDADEPVEVTEPGGWGPWVNGGAWLTVRGRRVDWIYRDLDRVRRTWRDCQVGRYEVGFQVGHPLGFYSHAYAGEVALCRVLVDPGGELAALQAEARRYPAALGDALVNGLWEADFAAGVARYGAAGADPVYAAGCLFRAIGVMCQALHGHAHRWLINEKGMVAAAGRLVAAPPGFSSRAHALMAAIGTSSGQIAQSVASAAALIAEVRSAVQPAATGHTDA